jgi:Mn-dependent DtxR family transcriptional regulator
MNLDTIKAQVREEFLKDCVTVNCEACQRDGKLLDQTIDRTALAVLDLVGTSLCEEKHGLNTEWCDGWNQYREDTLSRLHKLREEITGKPESV